MTDFLIRVVVDPAPGVAGAKKVEQGLVKVEGAADRLQKTVLRTFTGLGIGLGIRELQQLVDSYTNVQNRLRTVTDGQDELGKVTKEVFAIADRTRSAFDATAEVYARVGLAAKNLGRNQEELLHFTESLNQAVILSGATSAEASAGLIQLSQGLASGALRGDELRSVLEQLPVVADVIAKSLGITRGELRQMGAEGKISAEIVLDAFKKARVELDERFGKSVPTIGQSLTVLKNNLVEFIGTLDQASGTSAAISGVFISLAGNIDILAKAVVVLGTAILANLVRTAIPALIAQLKVLFTTLSANPFGLVVTAVTLLGVAIVSLADKYKLLQEEALHATEAGEKFALTDYGKVGADIVRVQENLKRVNDIIDKDVKSKGFANPAAVTLAARYQKQLADLGVQQDLLRKGTAKTTAEAEQQLKAMTDLAKAVDGTVASIDQQTAILSLNSREREVQKRLLEEVAKLEKDSTAKVTDAQKQAVELAIRHNQALSEQADALDNIRGPQEAFEAQLVALNGLLANDRITADEFNQAVLDLATNAKGVDLTKIQVPGFDGVETLQTIQDTIEATKEAARQESLRTQVLKDVQGPFNEIIEVQGVLVDLLNEGAITNDQYNEALARTEEQIRLLNPEYAAQKTLLEELNGPTEELVARQANLTALFNQGKISAEQYTEEIAKITDALNPLTTAEQLQAEVLESIKGPAAEIAAKTDALNVLFGQGKITLDEYNDALEKLHAKDQELGNSFGDGITSGLEKVGKQMQDIASLSEAALVNAFSAAEDALVEFATTGKFSFADFASSILADIAKIIARTLILQGIQALGGLGIPGLGGFTGKAHGGDVEANKSYIVGEKGPELFTTPVQGTIMPAGQTAQALQQNGGGGTTVVQAPAPEVKLSVVNVDSPEAARDAMDTDAGAKVVMNHIRSNRSAIKRELS